MTRTEERRCRPCVCCPASSGAPAGTEGGSRASGLLDGRLATSLSPDLRHNPPERDGVSRVQTPRRERMSSRSIGLHGRQLGLCRGCTAKKGGSGLGTTGEGSRMRDTDEYKALCSWPSWRCTRLALRCGCRHRGCRRSCSGLRVGAPTLAIAAGALCCIPRCSSARARSRRSGAGGRC